MGMLLSLIPSELWILVLLGTAFGVIFGIVPRGAIVGVIVCIFLMAFLGPIIGSVLESMPWWIYMPIMFIFGLLVIEWVIGLIFRRETAGELSGRIIYPIIRPFAIILIPLLFFVLFFGRR